MINRRQLPKHNKAGRHEGGHHQYLTSNRIRDGERIEDMEVATAPAPSRLREQHAIRCRSDATSNGALKRSRDDLPQKSQKPVASGAKLVTWGEIKKEQFALMDFT